ncbi:MAG TPA: hypothetical protein VFZ54_15710, partial [Burkholderiales bacterium]
MSALLTSPALLAAPALLVASALFAAARAVVVRLATRFHRALLAPRRVRGALLVLALRRAYGLAMLRETAGRRHRLLLLNDRLALGFGHAHMGSSAG